MEPVYDTEPETDGRPGYRKMISDLAGDFGTLARQELSLARAELSEKASEAKSGAVRVGIGSALFHAGALMLAGMCILGVTLILRTWMDTLVALFVSSIIVGFAFAAIGYALAKAGAKDLSPAHFVPRKTLSSIQEDLKWAKRKVA